MKELFLESIEAVFGTAFFFGILGGAAALAEYIISVLL